MSQSESSFDDEVHEVKGSQTNTSSGDEEGSSSHSEAGTIVANDRRILTSKENQIVKRSKWLVLSVILIFACSFGIGTYFFIDNEEERDFQSQFHDFATEAVSIANNEASNVFGILSNTATTITSYTNDRESLWPKVVIPHFEYRGRESNELSKALQVSLVPLVQNKEDWESFAVENQGWVQEGVLASSELHKEYLGPDLVVPAIPTQLYRWEGNSSMTVPQNGEGVNFGPGAYGPVWEQVPAPHDPSIINYDLLSHSVFGRLYRGMYETMSPVLSEVTDLTFLYSGAVVDDSSHPHSAILEPIYSTFEDQSRDDLLGFLVGVIQWDAFLTNLLPEKIEDIHLVLHNSCGEHHTYRINGPEAIYAGRGDLHERKYHKMEVSADFAPFLVNPSSEEYKICEYDLRIYPTTSFEKGYRTHRPWLYALVVCIVFMFTAAAFLGYDFLVQRLQQSTLLVAQKTNAIVSALFPHNVRDRLLQDAEAQAEQERKQRRKRKANFAIEALQKEQLKTFLDEEGNQVSQPYNTKPIADLFPSATVMFADIVGFTAWSSVREPTQVFTLLETVYHAFDEIAKRRRVFKVETVGDCYVAVAGLPDPRPDHAVAMSRFARECLDRMNHLTKQLEVQLGPDTGDLSMRIGLHSGPVTAGVLRGDKSRFQLFGDTVNTAARMESLGERNKIHLSFETANQLEQSNKAHWTKARTDLVVAKGKGQMQTFWLLDTSDKAPAEAEPTKDLAVTTGEGVKKPTPKLFQTTDQKLTRLIGWNTDVMSRLIKQIVARRNAAAKLGRVQFTRKVSDGNLKHEAGKTVLDEVKEIIQLPAFDEVVVENQQSPSEIELDEKVVEQLKTFVGSIASLYNDNPFHNFEHASHVTMSVVKLLSRIVTADALTDKSNRDVQSLHDHTFGITSDPMTQFACVFAALIHDVDHIGVPNATLVNEGHELAKLYKAKSVAEQNSVDLSWSLFMDDTFADLRAAICQTDEERNRFRELVVNCVMATDIVDKELKNLRNARWEKAFSEQANPESPKDAVNRKATIVIEHLIQASDVAHTMQHWHIYRKWNERFFHEMYLAYKKGRSESNPAEFWYKGEMGFFDFYIIPLAKKLSNCGVFGVSSDEYLNYAEKNRREWEAKGNEVVASMLESFYKKHPEERPKEESDDEEEKEEEQETAHAPLSNTGGREVPHSGTLEMAPTEKTYLKASVRLASDPKALSSSD